MKYATRINSFLSTHGEMSAAFREIGAVDGVDYVDLNYPEHTDGRTLQQTGSLLEDSGLKVNSIAMRFRGGYENGEFSNTDAGVRRRAIDLTKSGMDVATELGADSLTVWLGFDGYDYTFQRDYAQALDAVVEAYQEVADHNPDMRVSIEYKPYEERVFALVPNAGVTMNVLDRVDRPNMGMTLDFAHMLMAGEMPAFAASVALAQDRLYGIHLNDGNNRTDDGLMIGSVHPYETAELLYYLLRHRYEGVIYFDTFPIREDPSAELAANVATADLLIAKLQAYGIDRITEVVATNSGIASQILRNSLMKES